MDEVLIKIRLIRSAENLARAGSRFVLVQPQISFQGIQGLDAIVGGPYIRVEPGKGPPQTDFRGHTIGQDGSGKVETISYRIRSRELFSLNKGDPVTYRGLTVGTIGSVELSKDARWLEIVINIQNRYHRLINSRTVFWRESGVQANLGLFSSEIDISSVEALMKGAVGFATNGRGSPVKPGKVFDLAPKAPEGWLEWSPGLVSH